MAGMGPPPKANRRRRNADTFTGQRRRNCPACGSLRTDGEACPSCGAKATPTVPELAPEAAGAAGPRIAAPELPNPRHWLKATRDWWDAWTRSAQTAFFQPSDWETLKSLLPLVDGMHREKDPLKKAKLFEVVHRAEKALGGTHMERLRGRIDSGESGPGNAVGHGPREDEVHDGAVAVLAEYREMLEGSA